MDGASDADVAGGTRGWVLFCKAVGLKSAF